MTSSPEDNTNTHACTHARTHARTRKRARTQLPKTVHSGTCFTEIMPVPTEPSPPPQNTRIISAPASVPSLLNDFGSGSADDMKITCARSPCMRSVRSNSDGRNHCPKLAPAHHHSNHKSVRNIVMTHRVLAVLWRCGAFCVTQRFELRRWLHQVHCNVQTWH